MILTPELVDRVLLTAPERTIGVLGDLFLDRYFDLDGTLTEPSVETGLDAYQVVRVRSMPGAAGTVINNLVSLGVGRVLPLSLIGEDGEGYELLQALAEQGVALEGIVRHATRRTPTYMKPMLSLPGQAPRELNRLDIHPREPLDAALQDALLDRIHRHLPHLDALAILDQVRTPEAGVITARVRDFFTYTTTTIPILADSRTRIGSFFGVMLKPNEAEARAAVPDAPTALQAAQALAWQCGRPVFLTLGAQGIRLVGGSSPAEAIAAYPVAGRIDPVGAGDSTTAGILTALVAGLTLPQAAAFGCLVASITVEKIGTTGVATPEEIRARIQTALSCENS
jgi:rfaE bifunctional protein kinase chain/domain